MACPFLQAANIVTLNSITPIFCLQSKICTEPCKHTGYRRIASAISKRFCGKLTRGEIALLLDQLPETMISEKRKRLIGMFLEEKMKILASF